MIFFRGSEGYNHYYRQLAKALGISVGIHIIIFWLGSSFYFYKQSFDAVSIATVELLTLPSPKVVKKQAIPIKERILPKPEPGPLPKPEPKPKPKPERKPVEMNELVQHQPLVKDVGKPEKPEPKIIIEKQPSPIPAISPQVVPQVSIQTEDFPFSYYIRIIQNKVSQNWNPLSRFEKNRIQKKVVLYFKIFSDGEIDDISIKDSSDNYSFDQAALRAIADSIPFPPLPEEYQENYLGIYFAFEFSQ